MKTRHTLLFGMLGLGAVLAMPAAASDYPDDSFMVARRDGEKDVRQDKRDAGKTGKKAQPVQEPVQEAASREEPRDYGYGYERRQQEQGADDSRKRNRH
jgi:hypothetical protein